MGLPAALAALHLALRAPAPLPPIPTNAQCHALPPLPARRLPLRSGERLDYDVDFLGGIKAGSVTLSMRPPVQRDGSLALPVSVHAVSSQLVSHFGKVDSSATSYLRPRDLHPSHYREDFVGDGQHFWTEVGFPNQGPHVVHARWGNPTKRGEKAYPYGSDALDMVSAFYLLRALDLRVGQKLCFDVFGSRALWRIWGQVEGRELVVTPAGRFRTLRLGGIAARLNAPSVRRHVHLWLSDDAQRLPVAAIGELDLGPMRALLRDVGSGTPPTVAHDRRPSPGGAAGWTE